MKAFIVLDMRFVPVQRVLPLSAGFLLAGLLLRLAR
jgi:hypothetical protein